MNEQHPITPPPELERQWLDNDDFPFATGTFDLVTITKDRLHSFATQSARWGADQELEACVGEMRDMEGDSVADDLLAARRPKPPVTAEQALTQLNSLHADLKMHGLGTNTDTIRAALERLQQLEQLP